MNSTALAGAVRLAVDGLGYHISTLPREHEWELLYQPAGLDRVQVLRQFEEGALASVRFTVESADVASVLLFKPEFSGDTSRLWSFLVEQASGDPLPLFDRLQALPGLVYVALYSADDLVEVPDPVTAATFPWNDPWLIAAAVRDGTGTFDVRRGEAWPVIDGNSGRG